MPVVLRIQLHDEPSREYKPLREQLTKQGFQKTITSTAGQTYKLPWGTYLIEQRNRLEAGLRVQKAAKAAGLTTEEYSYLLVEAPDTAWGFCNLEPYREPTELEAMLDYVEQLTEETKRSKKRTR